MMIVVVNAFAIVASLVICVPIALLLYHLWGLTYLNTLGLWGATQTALAFPHMLDKFERAVQRVKDEQQQSPE